MNEALQPAEPATSNPPSSRRFFLAVGIGVFYGILMRLAFGMLMPLPGIRPHAGGAMLTSFLILTPFVVGMLMVYIERARITLFRAIVGPWLPMLLVLLISGMMAIEGSICILLATPIFLLASSFGGLVMFGVLRLWVPTHASFSLLLMLPLLLGLGERHVPLQGTTRIAASSVHIAAPPPVIWHLINDARGIQPREMRDGLAWQIGVPYPLQALTVMTPAGRVRKLQWQHGVHFDEPILDWQENRFIRWSYRFAPDSIPPGALDEHVRVGGTYFDLVDTSYALQPEGDGTRMSIRVGYRVTTGFNWYAGPLARELVGNAAETILHFYKVRSEAAPMVSDMQMAAR